MDPMFFDISVGSGIPAEMQTDCGRITLLFFQKLLRTICFSKREATQTSLRFRSIPANHIGMKITSFCNYDDEHHLVKVIDKSNLGKWEIVIRACSRLIPLQGVPGRSQSTNYEIISHAEINFSYSSHKPLVRNDNLGLDRIRNGIRSELLLKNRRVGRNCK